MFTNIVYLGYNDFRVFKRGVENVILSQSQSSLLSNKYYIFFGKKNEIYRWNGIVCISISNILVLKYLLLNYWLWRLKRSCCIIHSHNYLMSLFSCYKTDVFTIHDAIYYQRRSNKEVHAFLFCMIEKAVYKRCKKLHFISSFALTQALVDNVSPDKICIIHNTTPIELMCLSAPMREVLDEKYFNLFAVRGIQKRTRIDLLIDFAKYVDSKTFLGKKIRIYVAGKGDLLDYYRTIINRRDLHNIFLLGFIDDEDIIEYYRNCDMVILPCEYAEGFGLPIIEGYYFNKPVIASNRCAVPEIIYSSKYLFENTPESIWNTLVSIANDKVDYKHYYNNRFSLWQMTEKLSDLYKQVL